MEFRIGIEIFGVDVGIPNSTNTLNAVTALYFDFLLKLTSSLNLISITIAAIKAITVRFVQIASIHFDRLMNRLCRLKIHIYICSKLNFRIHFTQFLSNYLL